jgi:hypothetical protein
MSRLQASLDAPPSGRVRPIWFDAAAYGRARLIGGSDLPWQAPAELTAFFGKTQAMFGSDAILADVADVFAQRAAADQALRAAMGARSRPGYALRTLLADERARAIAAEAVGALAATKGTVPLVLTVPAPGRWLAAAAEQAHPGSAPPDSGQAETAAMYSADFLRTFGDTGVNGLLIDEGRMPAGELVHPEAYRPVLNVAEHYEWPVLIRTDAAAAWPHGPVPGVLAWIGSAPPAAASEPLGRWGVVAGPEFWADADPPADAELVLAEVPAQAEPEAVMKRVRALS